MIFQKINHLYGFEIPCRVRIKLLKKSSTAGAPPDLLEISAFLDLLKGGRNFKDVTAMWRPIYFIFIFVQVYSKSIGHLIGVFSAVDTAFLCIIDVLWCILNSMILSILWPFFIQINA